MVDERAGKTVQSSPTGTVVTGRSSGISGDGRVFATDDKTKGD